MCYVKWRSNFILALLAMALVVPAEAGQRAKKRRAMRGRSVCVDVQKTTTSNCTTGKCGTSTQTIEKTKTKTITKESRLQAWCREECRLQSLRGMGHYRGTPAGCYFCGVGVGSNSCRPHSGPPKASVTAYGYTTRVW
jgi:hypothetical protein